MSEIKEYTSVEQVKIYAYQYGAADEKFFEDVRPRAERLFDKLCGVVPGYFSQKSAAPEVRTFYGNNSMLLPLPPYFGDPPTISLPDGYTAPSFIVKAGYLMTVDSLGLVQFNNQYPIIWPGSIPISITAKWGFERVPDDVVEGCCELIIAIWRSKDQAFLKAINLETMSVVAQAIPDRVRLIASSYRGGNMMPAFV